MTIFDHPLWSSLKPYARISSGGRDNLDLLQLPDDLRAQAATVVLPCVACGELVRVFRARIKSKRSRVSNQPEERRMFYAATCPSSVNPGCARSRMAKDEKKRVRTMLSVQREPLHPLVRIEVSDASGMSLLRLETSGREPFSVDLPPGSSALRLVPIVD